MKKAQFWVCVSIFVTLLFISLIVLFYLTGDIKLFLVYFNQVIKLILTRTNFALKPLLQSQKCILKYFEMLFKNRI